MTDHPRTVAMVFSGGLGLAAYHAGVYQAFSMRNQPLHWVAGSSAGGITAALLAGNRRDERVARLREFWNHPPLARAIPNPWVHLSGWMGAIGTRLVGSAGHFRPRIPVNLLRFRSLYDFAPMKERIAKLIDFGLLNAGEIRLWIATTDIETGDPIIFDSSKQTLGIDHILASCGFLPEFAPVEIGSRLLGDGGLSLNAPFDPVLEAETDNDLLLYVIDLYARDGKRPRSLEAALERKNDLLFGNQTYIRLKYLAELRNLRRRTSSRSADGGGDNIVLLSYRPGAEEPGPEKSFELSRGALAQRWNAGMLDMDHALSMSRNNSIAVVRRMDRKEMVNS